MQLSYQFTCHDIVLWDNFPDGLMKKDIDSGKIALEIISSSTAKNLFIALKPKFLEIYRGVTENIPDLYAYQVRYDINQIREIIRLYGTKITQFKELYANHVAQNITAIAKVLWQKEPFPITIFNYYLELMAKENGGEQQLLDTVAEAHAMLYPTSYYEHQFEHLVNSKARMADAEFLYTVKLCYELALDRKVSLVEHLQSQIFGSAPAKDISRNLGSWIYLSGHYISMHDVPRDAIKFTDQTRLRIIDYLIDNFSNIISNSQDQLNSIGVFLGRNIQLLLQHHDNNQKYFLPYHIYQYMKSQRLFEVAIGQGAGEVFYLLEQPLQEQILDRIKKDGEFARGLGESLSNDFYKLSKPLQDEIFQISLREKKNNYNFQRGLGAGLGRKFRYLEADVQNHLLALTLQHIALAIGVGYGLAFNFASSSSVPKEFQNDIMRLAKENAEITRGLGMGLGQNYPFLNKMLQSEILRWTEKDPRLEFGFAYQLSFSFTSLTKEYQNLIFDRVERNSEFAYGSGFGFGVVYTYLPEDIQQRLLLDLAKRNIRFAIGLGAGIGNQPQYLIKEKEEELLSNIENNDGFATGITFGIGRSFTFLSQELQHKIWRLMQRNYRFAVGLGVGLGSLLNYMTQDLQQEVWRRADNNAQFAIGLGEGIGEVIGFLPLSSQDEIFARMEQNVHLSRGLGSGLGCCINFYLTDNNMSTKVSGYAKKNKEFCRGYGEGLGRIFSYWTEPILNDVIIPNAALDTQFAIGLGEGIGQSLPYDIWRFITNEDVNRYATKSSALNASERNATLERLFAFDGFSYGVGLGSSSIMGFMLEQTRASILQVLIPKYQNFAFGLGYGVGRTFSSLSLNQKLQEEMLELAEKSSEFARGLSQGLNHSLDYLDEVQQTKLTGSAKIKDYFNSPLFDLERKDVVAEFALHDNDFSIFLSPYDGRDIVDKRDKGLRQESDLSKENVEDIEILFSGKREKYCICYIDMVNSTQIASTLDESQLSKYYSTFLNSMATIAKNFGATIIKNAGDCLIYYFPSTSNSNEQNAFKDVIECGIAMISAHHAINAKLFEQSLPPLHYRISADYGKVKVARSSSSQSEDLFGSTMNVFAKINSKAPANGMVIGHNLYQIVGAIMEKEYNFERIGEYSGSKEAYPVYFIKTKQKRNILNPFSRTTETNIFDSNFNKDTDNNHLDY